MAATRSLSRRIETCSTVGEVLRWRTSLQPGRRAFNFLANGERETAHLTFAELDRRARAIAARLDGLGAKGERALLLYPPGLDYVTAVFGCLYAGAVAVPAFPPRLNRPTPRLQAIVRSARPAITLIGNQLLPALERRLRRTPELRGLPWLATGDIPAGDGAHWRSPDLSGSSLAFLQYASGSTATPRGVMLSHANVLHNLRLVRLGFQLGEHDLGISWLPTYHDMGLVGGVLTPVYAGVPVTFLSPASFLQRPVRWLEAIARGRGTISAGPDFAYRLCVEKITPEQRRTLDLSSWRVAACGAEPIQARTLKRFAEAFAPCGFRREAFYPSYGMAETTLMVSGGQASAEPVLHAVRRDALEQGRAMAAGSPEEPAAHALVGCGRAMPGLAVVIADPETRNRCPPEQVGEIWVSGPSVGQGYWNRPEESTQAFQGYLAESGEGPFLRTGDLGFLRGGELFVTGRLKDLIIIRGRNHYPQDIELTMERSHPALRPGGGAAFSIDVDGGEQLIAVHEVERRRQPLEVEEVVTALRHAVTERHDVAIHAVVLIRPSSLPRTSSGKVRRYACRERFLAGELKVVGDWRQGQAEDAGAADAAPAAESSLAEPEQVCRLIARQAAEVLQTPAGRVDLEKPLTAQGLDSLLAVELRERIDRECGLEVPLAAILEGVPIRQLAARLSDPATRTAGDLTAPAVPAANTGSAAVPPAPPAPLAAAPPPPGGDGDGVPLAARLEHLNRRVDEALERDQYFYERESSGVDGSWVEVDGRRLLMLASYSYLGLIGHPALAAAARDALSRFGTGTHGVRLLAGTVTPHRELEQAVASFKRAEDAVVFSSGYVTNLTAISTLVREGDWVICDQLDHASIVDGCRLSGARYLSFEHNDMASLAACLERARGGFRLVIVDAVFSMDGDVVDLPEVVRLCRRHGATLMVDEAHSLGVLGERGRGIEEHFGLAPDAVDLKMGTLSKAIPSVGGYVAGSAPLIRALKANSRAYIFSAALPPAQAAAARASLKVLEREPERVARLRRNARRFRSGLTELGFRLPAGETPIVPILFRSEEETIAMTRSCHQLGCFVVPVVFPAVPADAPRLRTTVTAAHDAGEIDLALERLARAGRAAGVLPRG